MEDLDNVLQAQERLTKIADELERARNAATLLDNAQEETQAIIEAAEAVVQHTDEFAGEGAEIIQRLQAMNLEQRLGEITRKIAETQELMDRQLDQLNDLAEFLREIPEHYQQVYEKLEEAERQRQSAQRHRQSAKEKRQTLLWATVANAVLLLALLAITLFS